MLGRAFFPLKMWKPNIDIISQTQQLTISWTKTLRPMLLTNMQPPVINQAYNKDNVKDLSHLNC